MAPLTVLVGTLLFILTAALLIYLTAGTKVVDQWERRPVFRLGTYTRTLEPGLHWVEPLLHSMPYTIDIREGVEVLAVNNAQTHDNIRLNLSIAMTSVTKPVDVRTAVLAAEDAWNAVETRAIAAVMEVVSRSTIDRILESRAVVCKEACDILMAAIAHWGITVLALEITDFAIADEKIEQAIAMKARAQKEAEAELRRAEMQHAIAEELDKAAAALTDKGWELKRLETLIELCRSGNNNTILIPTDLAGFAKIVTAKMEVV